MLFVFGGGTVVMMMLTYVCFFCAVCRAVCVCVCVIAPSCFFSNDDDV